MHANRVKTLSEHRENFAKFISLLTGELGVEAVFGDEVGSSGSKKIVLPKIEGLNEKRLNFLYALCLREAGLLSMSKRSIASVASHKTQGELGMSFAIESGRVERALMRKFAGAQEILDFHWKTEAADTELSSIAFGFNPKEASIDQIFNLVAKWALVGKPAYGWDKLFEKGEWNKCIQAVESEPIKSLISSSRLRSWNDARELAGKIWQHWTVIRGGDKTAVLSPSPKCKLIEGAEKALKESIPEAIKDLIEKRDEFEAKVKEAQKKAKDILGANSARLDILRKNITSINKTKAPFDAVGEHLADAKECQKKFDAAKEAESSVKNKWAQLMSEVSDRQKNAQEVADEKAIKNADKLEDLQKKYSQLQNQLDSQSLNVSEEVANRISELERKIEQAHADLEGKETVIKSKIIAEQEKLKDAEDIKREKLMKKVEELSEKLINAKTKTSEQISKMQERANEIKKTAEEKVQKRIEHLTKQLNELNERLTKAQEAAKEQESKALQKAMPTARQQEKMQKLEKQRQECQSTQSLAEHEKNNALRNAESEACKHKETKGMSATELLEKIEELEKALKTAQAEKDAIEEPVKTLMNEARESKKEISALNKQAYNQSHMMMKELQNQLEAEGIECDLVERMEEIDGWSQANKIQKEFDDLASKTLGEPVINGSGGGQGGRDVLEEIALKAKGIEEINPNEIFAGVEKLSPLSGFSDSGVGGNEGQVDQAEASGVGFSSKKPHLVWRKDKDKVIQAPTKNLNVAKSLKTRYAQEINEIKKAFLCKMKPSFKTKFRGGREEGQLDGRSIWKLAANQGDDFYETDIKKPDNKACASILIDLSGSLASLGDKANELLQACTLALSEGLAGCNIEHEVLGHSAPYEPEFTEQKIPDTFNRKGCRLETVVVKNFNEKGLAGLASVEVKQADNSDGEAVRIALNRLKKRPAKRKILFIISDGKPFMQDSDIEVLDEDLRKAVVEAIAQKVKVISIGFGDNGHPVFGKSHIEMKKLSDLAEALKNNL